MAITQRHILIRLYLVAGGMFLFGLGVMVKLVDIQTTDGDKYRQLALERTEKLFTIAPNRGNLYSDDGSLLATSVSKYTIRFDAVTVSDRDFEAGVGALSRSLSGLLGRTPDHYETLLRKARATRNRYALIARNLEYSEYTAIKGFPLFRKGPYKGGIIVEQQTVREHPLGKIAERRLALREPSAGT